MRREWAALMVVSCGGAQVAPHPPAPVAIEAPPPAPTKVMASRQELGSIDDQATEGTFRRMETAMQQCHRHGLRRVRYLAGDIEFFVRIREDGGVKYAFLRSSTLGDRETEKCMLDVVVHGEWPRPVAGEAEVRKRIGFDSPVDVKRPMDWPVDKVLPALHKQDGDARKCKAQAPGAYVVTAYVVGKGKMGRVQAVGISPPSAAVDDAADCIVKAIKAIRMPSPGPRPAKVTFVL